VLGQTEILQINTTLSDLAMQLVNDYALSHGMKMGDALIAVIALEHGATVLTSHAKHYSAVEALKVRGIF